MEENKFGYSVGIDSCEGKNFLSLLIKDMQSGKIVSTTTVDAEKYRFVPDERYSMMICNFMYLKIKQAEREAEKIRKMPRAFRKKYFRYIRAKRRMDKLINRKIRLADVFEKPDRLLSEVQYMVKR